MLDMIRLMSVLSEHRPIFHSEADFQHALAWQIHETNPNWQIRPEYPFPSGKNSMYLDIWIPKKGIAVELKYCTQKLQVEYCRERFALRDQSAGPLRRYDFLKDIARLERVVKNEERPASVGFAVFLTNDPSYWQCPQRETVDAAFRTHEGREISGKLAWADRASEGTTKGRPPIRLEDTYNLQWRDYPPGFETESYGKFRYLVVKVT